MVQRFVRTCAAAQAQRPGGRLAAAAAAAPVTPAAASATVVAAAAAAPDTPAAACATVATAAACGPEAAAAAAAGIPAPGAAPATTAFPLWRFGLCDGQRLPPQLRPRHRDRRLQARLLRKLDKGKALRGERTEDQVPN